jgi:hypothetical protein
MTFGPRSPVAGLLRLRAFRFAQSPMRKPARLAHAICLTLCLAPAAFAQDATPSNDSAASAGDANAPLTLDQVMADPDWMGAPIEQAWWSWDGQRAYTQRKRTGATIRDVYVQPIAGGTATVLDGSARATQDAAQPVYDAQHARMAFVRNGDVFVRDLRSGMLQQAHAHQRRRNAAAMGERWRPRLARRQCVVSLDLRRWRAPGRARARGKGAGRQARSR